MKINPLKDMGVTVFVFSDFFVLKPFLLKKDKVFSYSFPSVGPKADLDVHAVSPQVTFKPSTRW